MQGRHNDQKCRSMVTLHPLLLLPAQVAGQREGVADAALQISGWSTRLFGHGTADR